MLIKAIMTRVSSLNFLFVVLYAGTGNSSQAKTRLETDCFSWWCQVITGADEKFSSAVCFWHLLKWDQVIFETELYLKWGEIPGSSWFYITQKVSLDNSGISFWPCSLKIYNVPHSKAVSPERNGCGATGFKAFSPLWICIQRAFPLALLLLFC